MKPELNWKSIFVPFYVKISLILIGFLAMMTILFLAQRIVVPIIYSIILAIVLSPVVDFFTRKKMNRVAAISLTLFLFLMIVSLIVSFVCVQMIQFSDTFPQLVQKFHLFTESTVVWISDSFGLSKLEINSWMALKNKEILSGGTSAITKAVISTGNGLVVVIIILVYIFMILFYQSHLIEFVHRLFNAKKFGEVDVVLSTTKKIIQSYLIGLVFEALTVATLNVCVLLLIGIKYAVLLGVVGAIINVIPIVGGIISISLPMLMAFATKSPSHVLLVFVAYFLIQFFDNHYFIPKVVASKVKINALISVVVVLSGGALWGLPGMFLSIPLTAIIKVIFDHVEPLKPWGFLLGNSQDADSNLLFVKQNT
ncbi:MAG: AI-2E family transporter [Bacteroidota bacterium]